MRLRHPDGQTVHLAGTLASEPATDLRQLLDLISSHPAGVACLSLTLSPAFASTLAGSIGMRRRVQVGLASRGLEVVTLSAGFVHNSWRAWWTYLLDLAYILADLLPEDTTHGSVCTTVPKLGEEPWESAARELEDLSSGLTEIAWHTGSFIRVGCAQQDGTLLVTMDDTVRLLSTVDRTRVGACLDPARLTAHSETPAQALLKLRRANMNVVKVRLPGPGGQALLSAVLGGPHPLCDHIEAETSAALEEAYEELAILGLSDTDDRPMPGLGRSVL
ncbi:hypothetical protein Rhe02_13120 [Rhizocola hellebori]|uniref:Uncharacterized protein n=1 Tax=Rhizocola hellebori TaxID=1392758 RepID=A0A8J3Q4T6_9ACTN|nr:hypothetical protein [Rhizocola hellebori]GIH03245.1 hypothetical protein Rhe02_13120 [Rhizocola hellebori]